MRLELSVALYIFSESLLGPRWVKPMYTLLLVIKKSDVVRCWKAFCLCFLLVQQGQSPCAHSFDRHEGGRCGLFLSCYLSGKAHVGTLFNGHEVGWLGTYLSGFESGFSVETYACTLSSGHEFA